MKNGNLIHTVTFVSEGVELQTKRLVTRKIKSRTIYPGKRKRHIRSKPELYV